MTDFQEDIDVVCDLVRDRRSRKGKVLVGIAGPPASGKSTLAEAVVEALNAQDTGTTRTAALLPMDGYHLDNNLLKARGLIARKGAPETFDARGFCDAIRRLSEATNEMFFPRFDRGMDLSIANAIAIGPETPVVIIEGNYLLLNVAPWVSLRKMFAATVFVAPTLDTLRTRLLQRWLDHGLSPDDAMQRASENDMLNAEYILSHSMSADLTVQQSNDGKSVDEIA